MPPCSSSGLKQQGKKFISIEIMLLKAETNIPSISDSLSSSLSQTENCCCCSKGLLNQGNSGCVGFPETLDSTAVAGPPHAPSQTVPREGDNDDQEGTGEKKIAWRS